MRSIDRYKEKITVDKIRNRNFLLGIFSDLKKTFEISFLTSTNLLSRLFKSEINKLSTSINNTNKVGLKIESDILSEVKKKKVDLSEVHRLLTEIKTTIENQPEFPEIKYPDIPQFPDKINIEDENIIETLNKVLASIKAIKIPEPEKIKFPTSISVSNIPPAPKIPAFPTSISISNLPPTPKPVAFPKTIGIEDKKILSTLNKLIDKVEKIKIPEQKEVKFPESISVDNFPPQKIPQPVTSININPLRGYLKSTAVDVTTSATALPTTPMELRRSLIIYNNSSKTIYLGGSDVTTSGGFPIAAGTYSPPIDAGPILIVYAKVASGTAEVRVLEASNEAIGG